MLVNKKYLSYMAYLMQNELDIPKEKRVYLNKGIYIRRNGRAAGQIIAPIMYRKNKAIKYRRPLIHINVCNCKRQCMNVYRKNKKFFRYFITVVLAHELGHYKYELIHADEKIGRSRKDNKPTKLQRLENEVFAQEFACRFIGKYFSNNKRINSYAQKVLKLTRDELDEYNKTELGERGTVNNG